MTARDFAPTVPAAIGILILLASCAGPGNDWAVAANALGASALENTIARRGEQNDIQLRIAEAEYCNGVSIGALNRRYRDPAVMTGYLRLCETVRGLR